MKSQNSPRPEFEGSHHLPLYNILCALPQGQHSNDIFSQDTQVGVPKFWKLGLPPLWKPITLCANLRLKWGLKKNCSHCWEISNGMWHATYTPPTRKEIGAILDFSWSGVKLAIWLLAFVLAITYFLSIQMGYLSPFETSMFQDLSNDIRNFSIHWILTPAITF
jgi:hypothetical protein